MNNKIFLLFFFLFILRVSWENYPYAILLIVKRIFFSTPLKIMGCYILPLLKKV